MASEQQTNEPQTAPTYDIIFLAKVAVENFDNSDFSTQAVLDVLEGALDEIRLLRAKTEQTNRRETGDELALPDGERVLLWCNTLNERQAAVWQWETAWRRNGSWVATDSQCGGECVVETDSPAVWDRLPPSPVGKR